MKTRSLLVPSALILGAVLAACGGGSSARQEDATPPPSPTARVTQSVASATPAAVNTPVPEASPTLPPAAPSATAATGHSPDVQPTSPPPPPPPPATSTPVPPPPPVQTQFLTINAKNALFSPSQLSVQNGAPVSITFNNQDAGVAHDLIVYTPAGGIAGQSDVIVGPSQATVTFTPGGAGSYFFKCSLHPQFMTGSITVTP